MYVYVYVYMYTYVITLVGYTMNDIRYTWNDGLRSVGISNEVQLPQFQILGYRQRTKQINLTTGKALVKQR